jgi:copper(I)-binding protein
MLACMQNLQRLILPAAAAVILTAAALISFARSEEQLVVLSAWARATPPGASVGAVYVTLENRSGADDALVGASTSAAGSVSIHETVEENGVATMRPLDAVTVPAGGALEMRPGGAHLMLMDLSKPLAEGETMPLTLTFEKAGDMAIEVTVTAIDAEAAPEDLPM